MKAAENQVSVPIYSRSIAVYSTKFAWTHKENGEIKEDERESLNGNATAGQTSRSLFINAGLDRSSPAEQIYYAPPPSAIESRIDLLDTGRENIK